MTVNANEYKSRVGLTSLYCATVTEDCSTAYSAGTPAYLAPVAEATLEPTTNIETQYADDTVFDVMTAEGETKITLTITNYDPATLATILGKAFDVTSGRMMDNNATPPYCALSFKSLKSSGTYRYYQYMKGRFESPTEEFSTKGETPEPKPVELTYTAIYTIYEWLLDGVTTDSIKRIVGDEDTTNFVATGWFTGVQTPGYVAPSALALSGSVPADGATAVSLTANQTLTFNNALDSNATYGVNLILASDGSTVAGAITIDAARKVVTINPTASLGDTLAYILAYNVTDIYGSHLSGAVNFESASA